MTIKKFHVSSTFTSAPGATVNLDFMKKTILKKEKQQNSIHSVVVQGVNVFQFLDAWVNLL